MSLFPRADAGSIRLAVQIGTWLRDTNGEWRVTRDETAVR